VLFKASWGGGGGEEDSPSEIEKYNDEQEEDVNTEGEEELPELEVLQQKDVCTYGDL
jgi:hypothetical protein